MTRVYNKPFKQNFSKQDVDEWTVSAQHFSEYGVYTREPVKSKRWYDFWRQERTRCLNGYNNGRDYITGYHYNYLNYAPILKTRVIKENIDGQNQAERIEGFPNFFDGDYDLFHYLDEAEKLGQHAELLGTRGVGKSLKSASMLVRNYEHIPNSKSYAFAYSEEFLTNDGIITKAWSMMDHISLHTPWAKSRDEKNDGLHRKSSKLIKHNGIWVSHPKSYNSEIIGVIIGDRIDKARGKRGKLIIYEEYGMFKKADRAWMMNRPSMEDGSSTFGLQFAIGTGGTEGANFEGASRMFKKPREFNIYPVTNRWDAGKENTEVGYFWPGYINYEGCYNKENGVSDFGCAIGKIELDRNKLLESDDPTTLTRRKAEIPMFPDEALMRLSESLFPREELIAQESEIENNPQRYMNANFIGRLDLDRETQNYKWVNDDSIKPIYEYNRKTNKNMQGAIIIYEHPKTDNDGDVFQNRYFAGIDSYDQDESTTNSLGSIFIGDIFTKRIVAEYTGRPKTAEEFYEVARRLQLYYNARANYENANRGIFTYYKSKNCEYLMLDEPKVVRETISDTTLQKGGRRKTGTTPSPAVQQYSRGLIVKWLLDLTNNPDKPEEMCVHKLRTIAAIREMILWNSDGNFDRVDALCMLMLAWQDMEIYRNIAQQSVKSLALDPFFTRNYKQTSLKWKKMPN